jgi:hypothetical protein
MFAAAGFAVAFGLMVVAAPTANAVPYRQVYGKLFFGPPSVTVPECESAGQTLQAQGRFDFYRCVTFDANSEELEGFLITG